MKLTKSNWLSIAKATVYAAVSAALAYLISLIAGDPNLFGPLTPVVNVILITVKKFFETD